jgi:hypothetical protein
MLKAGRSQVRFPMRSLDISSIDIILPAVSSQPLTEMSTRNLPGGKGRPARKADNSTTMSRLSKNVGASTSHNPVGLHDMLQK